MNYNIKSLNNIPNNWNLLEIDDVLSLLKDGSHNPPKRQKKGIKFISGATDIKYFYINFDNCTYISQDDYKTIHKYYEIKENDILLTIVGTLGNTAIVKSCDLPFSLQRSIAILRCNNLCNHLFLFYWLNTPIFQKLMYNFSNPSAQPGIYLNNIRKLPIAVPPISEQNKIVDILYSLDKKIQLNTQMNATLEAIGQALFKRWFVDFEFPDENGNPYRSSGGEMVDSELGPIPKGWEIYNIKSIGRVVTGSTPSTKNPEYYGGAIPFITIPDMKNNNICYYTDRYITQIAKEKYKNKVIPKNTICVSCIATPGLVSLSGRTSLTNQQINSIIVEDNLINYIYFYMKKRKELIINLGSGGSATLNLNKTNFEKIPIIMPNYHILIKFNNIVNYIFPLIHNNIIQNYNLSIIRDTLLPKLMSGELRVPLEEGSG